MSALVYPGLRWSGDTITFSIPGPESTWSAYAPGGASDASGNEPFRTGYSTFSAVQAQSFRAAISAWASLIPIKFVETDDKTNPGDIRVAFTDTGWSGAYAYVAPTAGSTGALNGDIWVSNRSVSYTLKLGWDFAAGDMVSPVLLHEIGHALGLKHSFDSGPVLPSEFDNVKYTVMTYQIDRYNEETTTFSEGNYNNQKMLFEQGSRIFASKPMVYDIAAIQSIYGVNTETRSGQDSYTWEAGKAFIDVIYDAGGIDVVDLTGHSRRSIIDLTPGSYSSIDIFDLEEQKAYWGNLLPQYKQEISDKLDKNLSNKILYMGQNNLGIAFSTIIENAEAGSGSDVIIGNAASNRLSGNGGADRISGDKGDDVISGGAGADILDGGLGFDEARYGGVLSDYSITLTQTGWTVADGRAGSPDGADLLTGFERLAFADQKLSLGDLGVATAVLSILRFSPATGAGGAMAVGLTASLTTGSLSMAGAITEVVKAAGATTSVATLSYEFFTGKIPGQAGIDYLVSPTGPNANNLNSAYYQSFNLENRYINFAVNLGKNGEGKDAFTSHYGTLSLFDATRDAYKAIFGAAPTDAKIHALIDSRVDYFASYGGDGAAGLGTKAAMVGWLLAEAEKADLGVMARSNGAWLTDLADGSAPFAVNILDPANGYYKVDYVFGG